MQLIHFAVHLKLTQHCKSTILQEKFKKKNKLVTEGNSRKRDKPDLAKLLLRLNFKKKRALKMTLFADPLPLFSNS